MSDVGRVLSWFDSGRLLRPDPALPTTVHLALAVARLAGANVELDGPARQISNAIGEPEHLVFVMADGLGMNLVESRPEGSFFKRHLVLEMRSVFPSSTAPALTSLATGLWPDQHALTGWNVYLPGLQRQVTALPYIERFTEKPASQVGVSRDALFPMPVLASQFRRSADTFMPRRIADSVYSRYVHGDLEDVPYDKLHAGISAVVARIKAAPQPTYSYFYHSAIDTAEHDHGPSSRQTKAEVDRLELALERLEKSLAGRARVVVSADHGQFDITPQDRLFVRPNDEISELLVTPPSGEGRTPVFHCLRGTADEFARRFRVRFGEHFALLSVDEVEALRLLGPGPLAPETRSRLGDYLGLSSRGEVILYSPDKETAALKGFHGGLTPAEVRIPLIVA